MQDRGLSGKQVEISVEKKTTSPDSCNHPPMETRLLVMGVGLREKAARTISLSRDHKCGQLVYLSLFIN